MIYLIKKLWIDGREIKNTYGYEIIGYVTNEEEAIKIANSEFVEKAKYPKIFFFHGTITDAHVPRFIYEKLEEFKVS